ncbi:MAG TPA: extracellular solute-binding protein [Anaerolineales bacterium]|nr:extracellular solute-binding protein [Anaerolineales bacterium]
MKNLNRFLIPVLVVLSMVLAACGAPAAPTDAPATQPPGGAATGECPAGVEGMSIEMWSPFTGGDGDEMTALAERFSSENPCGITVTHVAQPEYQQKLEAAAAAGGLPAMTAVHATRVAALASRNVLKPFGPEAMAVLGDELTSNFPEDLWSRGEFRGQRYSIPLDVHPLIMFYNKDLFEQAGIEPPGAEPWTSEQFEDALAKLEAIDVTPISLGNAFQAAALFQALIRQYGGSLTDESGATATYNSEAGVRALEKIKELRDKYTPDIAGTGDPEVNFFKEGNVGMVFHGPWWISDLSQLDFVGFAPLPTIGDQPATWGGSHHLALTTEDPTTQAAAAVWIKWLSDNSAEWAAAGQVPARQSVRDDPDLASVAAPIASVAESANMVALPAPVAGLEGALWDQFGPAIDAFLAGDVADAQTALDQAAATSQQVMEENLETFGE